MISCFNFDYAKILILARHSERSNKNGREESLGLGILCNE